MNTVSHELRTPLSAIKEGIGIVFDGIQGEVGEEKFYALLVAMVGTIVGLGCAADLFNLWVWFEAMAVSSYLLVTFYREEPASLEAGMKYIVQSAAGSVLVLIVILVGYLTVTRKDVESASSSASEPSAR